MFCQNKAPNHRKETAMKFALSPARPNRWAKIALALVQGMAIVSLLVGMTPVVTAQATIKPITTPETA
jgi:hypothetical protein